MVRLSKSVDEEPWIPRAEPLNVADAAPPPVVQVPSFSQKPLTLKVVAFVPSWWDADGVDQDVVERPVRRCSAESGATGRSGELDRAARRGEGVGLEVVTHLDGPTRDVVRSGGVEVVHRENTRARDVHRSCTREVSGASGVERAVRNGQRSRERSGCLHIRHGAAVHRQAARIDGRLPATVSVLARPSASVARPARRSRDRLGVGRRGRYDRVVREPGRDGDVVSRRRDAAGPVPGEVPLGRDRAVPRPCRRANAGVAVPRRT